MQNSIFSHKLHENAITFHPNTISLKLTKIYKTQNVLFHERKATKENKRSLLI